MQHSMEEYTKLSKKEQNRVKQREQQLMDMEEDFEYVKHLNPKQKDWLLYIMLGAGRS